MKVTITSAPPLDPNDQPPPYSAVMAGYSAPPAPPAPHQPAPPPMGFVLPQPPPAAYPQPPHHAPHPASPPPQGHVYAAQPINVIMAPPVGNEPSMLTCPSCLQPVTTKVEYRTSWHTHVVAGIICFTTMFFSMCCLGLVPYCCDACKNAEHYCPNCNAYIGKYEKC